MKKAYSNPEMEIVKIQAPQILAGSDRTEGFGTGTQDGSSAVARRGWFDDSDDE